MDDFKKGDELWEALGRVRRVEVSPYFTRRVLRDALRAAPAPGVVFPLFRWLTASVFAAVAVAFLMSVGSMPGTARYAMSGSDSVETFDIVAGIDTIVVTTDVSEYSLLADF